MTTRSNATRRTSVAVYFTLGVLVAGAANAVDAPPASSYSGLPLTRVADIPLGGHLTRFDYESFDPTRRVLFIAHLRDSRVIAFDTQSSRVIGSVADVASVHGVLAIPKLGRVYATATGTRGLVSIDMATLRITARLPTGAFPNGMAYAPDAHKLYVSDQSAGELMVVDVRSNKAVTTVSFGGAVGNTQFDPVSKHIFDLYRCHQGCGRDGANPWNLGQLSADCRFAMPLLDLCIQLVYLFTQFLQVIVQTLQQLTKTAWQIQILQDPRQALGNVRYPLRNNHAKLR
jgi:YVTN family beta-propeller protein